MSQIVVDTDVASYIFNWHTMAQQYVNALRGSDLILSFMSVAELRMRLVGRLGRPTATSTGAVRPRFRALLSR